MPCSLCTSKGSPAGCPLSDTHSLSFYYVVPQSNNTENYLQWWSTALLHIYTKSNVLTLTTDELTSYLTVKGLRPMGDFPGFFSPSHLLPTATLEPLEKLCSEGGGGVHTTLPTSPSSSFSIGSILGGVISSLSQLVVSPTKESHSGGGVGTPQKPSPPPSRWLHAQHCATLLSEVVSLWERHVGAASPLFLLQPHDLPLSMPVGESMPCSLPQLLSLHASPTLQSTLLSSPSTLHPHAVSFLLPFAVSTQPTLTVSRCATLPGSPLLLHLKGQGQGSSREGGGGETTLLILRYLIASRTLAAEALEGECATLHAKVVKFAGLGMKDVAAAYLQRIHRVRTALKRRQGALGNLEAIKEGMVSQKEAKESVEQMREFRDTLAALEVDESEAEEVMDEVREELRKVEAVHHTLNTLPQTYSAEVMEELDALLLGGATTTPLPIASSSPAAAPSHAAGSPLAPSKAVSPAKVPSPSSTLKVSLPS